MFILTLLSCALGSSPYLQKVQRTSFSPCFLKIEKSFNIKKYSRSNFRTVAQNNSNSNGFFTSLMLMNPGPSEDAAAAWRAEKAVKRRVRNKTQFRPWISIWTCIYIWDTREWSSFLFSLFFVFITLWKLHRVFRNFLTFSCLARLRFKGFFHKWWCGNCRSWLSQLMASHVMSRCQDVPNKNQGQIQDLREVGCRTWRLGVYMKYVATWVHQMTWNE